MIESGCANGIKKLCVFARVVVMTSLSGILSVAPAHLHSLHTRAYAHLVFPKRSCDSFEVHPLFPLCAKHSEVYEDDVNLHRSIGLYQIRYCTCGRSTSLTMHCFHSCTHESDPTEA